MRFYQEKVSETHLQGSVSGVCSQTRRRVQVPEAGPAQHRHGARIPELRQRTGQSGAGAPQGRKRRRFPSRAHDPRRPGGEPKTQTCKRIPTGKSVRATDFERPRRIARVRRRRRGAPRFGVRKQPEAHLERFERGRHRSPRGEGPLVRRLPGPDLLATAQDRREGRGRGRGRHLPSLRGSGPCRAAGTGTGTGTFGRVVPPPEPKLTGGRLHKYAFT